VTASLCRSCGAPILWVLTTHGKRMPLDAEPDPAGNVSLDQHRVATVHTGGSLAFLAVVNERWMPHHATCPQADQWRKR
jgi:hypothetical protein